MALEQMVERWTEDEISEHCDELFAPWICGKWYAPWIPIAPRRVLKNGPIAPRRVLKNGMVERWTEDEISEHCDELFAPWICGEWYAPWIMVERWTEDEISEHPIAPRRVLKNGPIAPRRVLKNGMVERWTEDEISEHHEEMQKTELMKLKMSDERIEERVANKISAIEEQTDVNFPDYSSKLKKGTFVLCSQFLPCAGGNDLEDSQQKQQTVNGIYQHTLRTVSHCPSVSDFIQRATDKCAEVCTNNIQDDGCSYHCMRDSYKTSLVEFCAKPKLLFDFCPEYDPIGQTIQKDIYTLCKPSNPLERVYSSSDLFFCDQGSCLQLRDAGVTTGVTSLMTDTTPVSGDLNESWLSQNWFVVLLSGVAVTFVVACSICLYSRLRRFIAFIRKLTKIGNPNNVQDDNEQAALHNEA